MVPAVTVNGSTVITANHGEFNYSRWYAGSGSPVSRFIYSQDVSGNAAIYFPTLIAFRLMKQLSLSLSVGLVLHTGQIGLRWWISFAEDLGDLGFSTT